MKSPVLLFAASTSASLLWDGRFNDLTSASDLEEWSWENQVGPYQWYIHGSGPVDEYVELAPEHKNPNDTATEQGAKITLTDTAYWNGQNMRRTELIPQTTAAIADGKVWYHFSLQRKDVNPPNPAREHQIAFFESHFTELKYGGSSQDLGWFAGGAEQWSTPWEAGTWHNVAYEIDFTAGTVGFWHSEGSEPLELVVEPVSASTESNGQDWHVGVLELPVNGEADALEDLFWSGVYIEDGEITTDVSGPPSA